MSPLMPPFIVYALSRSRTAWLAKFLNYGPWSVTHDAMMEFAAPADLKRKLAAPGTGLVETGMAFAWRLARRYSPNARLAVVRRPTADVIKSLNRFGISMNDEWIAENERRLEEISALPGALTVSFDELATEDGCRRIFEHCTMQPFDRAWWQRWAGENVQIDMPAFLKEFAAREEVVDSLVYDMRSLVTQPTFQRERWATFHPECLPLMKMHSDEVGEYHPKMPYDPNVEMAQELDRTGSSMIVTARAGDRLVGYLCFFLHFNLESKRVLCATQSGSFIHKDFRVGNTYFQLYNEALRLLRAVGVNMTYMRHGRRGRGAKMGPFFKKLGAEENGADYTLWIGD